MEIALLDETHNGLVFLAKHLQQAKVVRETMTGNGHVGANVTLHAEDGIVIILVRGLGNDCLSGFKDLGIRTGLGAL